MEIVYSNFDGLELSFQCLIPEYILSKFREAKLQAQAEKSDVAIWLNGHTKPIMVAETGSRGGYAFRFDTGIDGENWVLADTQNPDIWNARVSVKSLCLALNGYEKTKKKIMNFLQYVLRAKGKENIDYETGEITYPPLERVSRFDYCIDFKLKELNIVPRHFIIHNRFGKTLITDENPNLGYSVMYGDKYSYIRIGTMPNRQLVLYDKIKDIKSKNKSYWYKFWSLDPNNMHEEQIWRLEIRAGKKELNKWNLRRFEDFDNKVGDVILQILNDIRHTIPNENDLNVSRWPNSQMWEIAIKRSNDCLNQYISNAKRSEVITIIKSEAINRFEKQFTGLFASYTALLDQDMRQIPVVIDGIKEHISGQLITNQKKMSKKFKKAKNKYHFGE